MKRRILFCFVFTLMCQCAIGQCPEIDNPGDQEICDSYTLPMITGTNLSENPAYYDASQLNNGVIIMGAITTNMTVWIYDENNGCSDEESFEVTINPSPEIDNPGDQESCDSYTLPMITGTNLSENPAYYDASQSNNGVIITGAITTNMTVWIYDENNGCSDEESFEVTINPSPEIDNPGDQESCDSYTLPMITGTNLSENPAYYDASQLNNGVIIMGAITTNMTVWIYDENNGCSDEESFEVTINPSPEIDNPGDQESCDSYTLPMITGTNLSENPAYYDASQSNNGVIITGAITTNMTVWIYDENNGCSDEESFEVTINPSPEIDNPGDQESCDSYTLPMITGTNLSENPAYYDASQLNNGVIITGAITTNMTVWIYDENNGCSDEESFEVTINPSPEIDNPGDQESCDSYTLPMITGTNLSENPAYYDASQLNNGVIITGAITTNMTVWIYDENNGCSDEESFEVTINPSPEIDNPGDQELCDSYTLPMITGTNLSENPAYYDASQSNGGDVITGSITTDLIVWIYDENNGCSDEESFEVTINLSPIIDNPGDQVACGNYNLLPITGENLSGNEAYYDNSQILGGTPISDPIMVNTTIWIYDEIDGCNDEESFDVTIVEGPELDNPGDQIACDSFVLPEITGMDLSGNEAYYDNSQSNDGMQIDGSVTESMTVWIFDSNEFCSTELIFEITIIESPIIDNPGDQTACDDYFLTEIMGTNLSGSQAYFDNNQENDGEEIVGSISESSTIWIFDEIGGCSDEESFQVLIIDSPVIDNPGDQTACDNYSLSEIMGSGLSGSEAYYDNSQSNEGVEIEGSITENTIVWIYDEFDGCSDEESFEVVIFDSPVIDNPGDQTLCDSYELPDISGINLSGNETYYNDSQQNDGTEISNIITESSVIWIYDMINGCSDETSFIVTINTSPVISNPGNQSACDILELPDISGMNLSGNEAYFDNSQVSEGKEIDGIITSSMMVWIYDTSNNCEDEESFIVTITNSPEIENPGNQIVCDEFVLPEINGNNLSDEVAYFDNSQADNGEEVVDPIISNSTIWIFDEVNGCTDEESFLITINITPSIDNPGDQMACDSFVLGEIFGVDLTQEVAYYDNSQENGGLIEKGPLFLNSIVWIFDENNGCNDEESFSIIITPTPIISNPGDQVECDSYELPTINGTNLSGSQAYYNDSQFNEGTLVFDSITATNTIWIYDENNGCSDEESFEVLINKLPNVSYSVNSFGLDPSTAYIGVQFNLEPSISTQDNIPLDDITWKFSPPFDLVFNPINSVFDSLISTSTNEIVGPIVHESSDSINIILCVTDNNGCESNFIEDLQLLSEDQCNLVDIGDELKRYCVNDTFSFTIQYVETVLPGVSLDSIQWEVYNIASNTITTNVFQISNGIPLSGNIWTPEFSTIEPGRYILKGIVKESAGVGDFCDCFEKTLFNFEVVPEIQYVEESLKIKIGNNLVKNDTICQGDLSSAVLIFNYTPDNEDVLANISVNGLPEPTAIKGTNGILSISIPENLVSNMSQTIEVLNLQIEGIENCSNFSPLTKTFYVETCECSFRFENAYSQATFDALQLLVGSDEERCIEEGPIVFELLDSLKSRDSLKLLVIDNNSLSQYYTITELENEELNFFISDDLSLSYDEIINKVGGFTEFGSSIFIFPFIQSDECLRLPDSPKEVIFYPNPNINVEFAMNEYCLNDPSARLIVNNIDSTHSNSFFNHEDYKYSSISELSLSLDTIFDGNDNNDRIIALYEDDGFTLATSEIIIVESIYNFSNTSKTCSDLDSAIVNIGNSSALNADTLFIKWWPGNILSSSFRSDSTGAKYFYQWGRNDTSLPDTTWYIKIDEDHFNEDGIPLSIGNNPIDYWVDVWTDSTKECPLRLYYTGDGFQPRQEIDRGYDSEFVIYPNPNSGQFTIDIFDFKDNIKALNVHNRLGQVLYSTDGDGLTPSFEMSVDDLFPGVYLISLIYNNGKVRSKKVVIIK